MRAPISYPNIDITTVAVCRIAAMKMLPHRCCTGAVLATLLIRDEKPFRMSKVARTGIATARGTEMYLPLWLSLWGVLGTEHFNIAVRAA